MALLYESIYGDIITFAIVFLGAVYWWLSSKYTYWSDRGVPGPKPSVIFWNAKDIVLRKKIRAEVYQEVYNELGGNAFGGVYFFSQPAVLLKDPELIKACMVKDFTHFQDRETSVSGGRSMGFMGYTLLALRGSSWKNLRSKLTPTFSSGQLKAMISTMAARAGELTACMPTLVDADGCADVKEVSARFTTDVVGSCVFGLQSDAISNPDSAFRKMGVQLFSPSASLFLSSVLLQHLPRFLQKLLVFFKRKGNSEYFLRLIADTVKEREEKGIVRNDFLQLLLDIRNKEKSEKAAVSDGFKQSSETSNGTNHGEGGNENESDNIEFDDRVMAAQCIVFFVAGFETTSTTMSYCLYELASNQGIQEKLKQEIDTVLGRHNGLLTYDALKDMKYLDQVIDETLRKHPPAGSVSRRCNKPYVIPGTKVLIEEGMIVHVPIYALHHDPKYYPQPEKFDPERFSEENKSKRHHFTYLPFGDGPRMCIGMRFALLQAKVGLAALVSKFRFTPCPKTPSPLCFDVNSPVASVKGPLRLQITKRMAK
ncbi:probable cytochrome P450 6a14 [Bacillus rossius redtenbacheri]|uniref:probable cytochrome P450 6a14 n=1 Tax=Bacillus rossius redtenbacheri TaxID=93214 RepID=UPI002FDD23D3